jgi:NAD-dependent SIR2 family protein deacetylase
MKRNRNPSGGFWKGKCTTCGNPITRRTSFAMNDNKGVPTGRACRSHFEPVAPVAVPAAATVIS